MSQRQKETLDQRERERAQWLLYRSSGWWSEEREGRGVCMEEGQKRRLIGGAVGRKTEPTDY